MNFIRKVVEINVICIIIIYHKVINFQIYVKSLISINDPCAIQIMVIPLIISKIINTKIWWCKCSICLIQPILAMIIYEIEIKGIKRKYAIADNLLIEICTLNRIRYCFSTNVYISRISCGPSQCVIYPQISGGNSGKNLTKQTGNFGVPCGLSQ